MPAAHLRPIAASVASLLLVFGTGCSDGSSEGEPEVTVTTATDGGPATPSVEDPGDSPVDESGDGTAQTADAGHATLVIDSQTWEFDEVQCGFGADGTGIEGATVNLAARSGSLSLYLAAEPDLTYIELDDLGGGDDGINFTTMGGAEPVIEVDGRSVTATGEFHSANETGGQDGPFTGSLTATCP